MLQDIAGVGQIEGPGREGQGQTGPAYEFPRRGSAGGELAGIGLDTDILRAGGGEGRGEISRSTPDVEDPRAVERTPLRHLVDRVGREEGVEVVRIGLLDAEGAKKPHRAPQGALWRRHGVLAIR